MKMLLSIALIFCSALSVGCAGGEKYGAVVDQFAPIPADQGRLFFYRSNSMVGSGIQPKIRVNGEVVGKSKPGGFFFVDQAAGDCEVMCSTEVKRKLTFTLAPQETRYVRTAVKMGVIVYQIHPELVDADEALKGLKKSKYIGRSLED